MKQEIPKPLRNALARQASGEVHPSPDVLTSFVERTLAPAEGELVTQHLAQCADCREIVFLTSNAAEEEVRDERPVEAAAVGKVAPMPVYASARPDTAQAAASGSRWTIRTRWAVLAAAAVVVVSSGVVLKFWHSTNQNPTTITVAGNQSKPAPPEAKQNTITTNSQEGEPASPPAEGLAKAAPQPSTKIAQAKKAGTQPTGTPASTAELAYAPEVGGVAKARSETKVRTLGAMNTAVVPQVRPQSSFPEGGSVQQSGSARQYKFEQQDKSAQQDKPAQQGGSTQAPQLQERAPALFGKSGIGEMHASGAVRPQWRIGTSGHLERSLAAGQWSHVLDDQPVTFHAVAVIGSDVWAGGNGGALFHSSDGGEHWSKVSLSANSNAESGALVSIRFDDAQHGTVASDNGNHWATTDGGLTWMTQ